MSKTAANVERPFRRGAAQDDRPVGRMTLTAIAVLASVALRAGAQCAPAITTLLNDGKMDEARAEVDALLKKNASDDAALHCMGRVYEAMNKSGEAADWFEKAIKVNDKVALHHLWLGNALGDQAQHANKLKQPFLAKRVKSEFERTVALDPTSIDGRHGLIQFYSQAPGIMGGSMDKAREQAREIQKLNAMRGHVELATLLEKDKDLAGAEREFEASVAAAPDSGYGYSSLAAFYRRQKRYDEAATTWDRLLKARPDLVNAHLNLAFNLALSGQGLDRGDQAVKGWLAAPPKDATPVTSGFAHYVLGMIYERQGKKDVARAEYQTALTLNPKHVDAKKALDALR
jgi:tetratricopeptide (TPR) repeat protein